MGELYVHRDRSWEVVEVLHVEEPDRPAARVVVTDPRPGAGEQVYTLRGSMPFDWSYRKAKRGTPRPVQWPSRAQPPLHAVITTLGRVREGWWYRFGSEPEGQWRKRSADGDPADPIYGALVYAMPPHKRPCQQCGGSGTAQLPHGERPCPNCGATGSEPAP